ncbi:MAG: hypothetical protein ABI131_00215 [Nostocoides sp.]
MRKSLSNATARFHSFARRGETQPRGWYNGADRDADRMSLDLLILSQMRQQDR